jgi:hypothetical protein
MNKNEKEYIKQAADDKDTWYCICGNTPIDHGFYPCDERGNEVEPVKGSWKNLYICGNCGRIINQDTLEVVGANHDPEFLYKERII